MENAEKAALARLIQMGGDGEGQAHPVVTVVKLGRASECDVSVHGTKVSREHCMVRKIRDQYFVLDLGSKNGTLVNGVRHRICHLRDGDVIKVGNTPFEFRLGSEDSADASQLAVSVVDGFDADLSQVPSTNVNDLLSGEVEATGEHEIDLTVTHASLVLRRLADVRDAETLADALADLACSILKHADRCAVLLKRGWYDFPVPMASRDNQTQTDNIVMLSELADEVMRTGKAFVSADVVKDLGLDRDISAEVLKAQSLAACPIILREATIGLLYAETVRRGFYFTLDDLYLLVFLSALAPMMITRTRAS